MIKNKNLKERGITLVALVITIIVLLILAGVTLNIVLNGGIIDKSQNAVSKYQETSGNETDQINYLDAIFGNFIGNLTSTSSSTPSSDPVTPDPEPSTPGTDNKTGSANTKLGSSNYAYNNPVVPVGFETVEITDASWALEPNGVYVADWNKGLVIQDASGNQFVWVPVAGNNETNGVSFATYNYNTYYAASTYARPTDYVPGITDEDEGAMVTYYGGFYIGRYEAGIPETFTTAISTASADARNKAESTTPAPVVKQNQVPWNYIAPTNCKTQAEKVVTFANTNSHTQSILTTDLMWDTTLSWIETTTSPATSATSNCQTWGNYNNATITGISSASSDYGASWNANGSNTQKSSGTSWLLKTGHSDYTKRKNIYDIAGNLWEYTNSIYDSSSYAIRGGGYYNAGSSYVAAYRLCYDTAEYDRRF